LDNVEYRNKLRIQIREAYGRVVYTYTTHLKFMNNLKNKLMKLKQTQIFLSAVSSGGFLATVFLDKIVLSWVSGIVSIILLVINLYFKDFNLSDEIKQHQVASDRLWLIREKYISLLTDMNELSVEEIKIIRDELQDAVSEVYSSSPKTDSKSYKQAQNALKNEDEQFFKSEEIDKMLPEHLREKV